MSSGKQQVGTSVTTSSIPSWQEDDIKEVSLRAEQAWDNRANTHRPWEGATNAPLSALTEGSLLRTEDIARTGTQLANQAYGTGQDLIRSHGINEGMQGVLGNLSGFAQGNEQEDPRLQRQLDINAQRMSEQVNSAMSGAGRYGSFAHAGEMANRIGEINNPVMLAANEAARGRQMQANQMMSGIYDAGLNRAGSMMALSPELEQARYIAADRMGQIGSLYDQRAQNDLNSQIEKWNMNESRESEALARYSAIVRGMGGLGGSTSSTVQTQPAPSMLQQVLGGAMAGTGILGKF